MNPPIVLSNDVTDALKIVVSLAERHPVDQIRLRQRLATRNGKRLHSLQLSFQSVVIPGPWPFCVTYTVDTGLAAGRSRHMSMSIKPAGRVPSPEAVWMIAKKLGFRGTLTECSVWPETLATGEYAINIVQPIPS